MEAALLLGIVVVILTAFRRVASRFAVTVIKTLAVFFVIGFYYATTPISRTRTEPPTITAWTASRPPYVNQQGATTRTTVSQ